MPELFPLLPEPILIGIAADHGGYELKQYLAGMLRQAGHKVILKQVMLDKLIEHKHYIDEHGQDLPEIRDWKWSAFK